MQHSHENQAIQEKKHFIPPWYIKGPMIQTLLNSAKFRNRGTGGFEKSSSEKIIDAGKGVRLQGFLSKQTEQPAKGLIILFHGWEGSAESAYMVSTGRFFYDRGYNIFRLNMRDHGESHQLNEGFFLGTLIDEVWAAVKKIINLHAPGINAYLAGFSMGANFCIRVAKRASDEGFTGLNHVFAVNPPMDPLNSTRRIDTVNFLRKYFLKKWKRSLAIKQELYPKLYNFNNILSMKGCIPMTERLLEYTPYSSLEDYFGRYTLKEGYLDGISLPFTLLTSKDDPIIPYTDIASAKMSPSVHFILQENGGHCGYIMNGKFEPWYLGVMLGAFGKG